MKFLFLTAFSFPITIYLCCMGVVLVAVGWWVIGVGGGGNVSDGEKVQNQRKALP